MKQPDGFAHAIRLPNLVIHRIGDDGVFPNNANLPLLVYLNAVELPDDKAALLFEQVFASNAWGGSWRDGVFGFHHYHSTAHEVLGVYAGTASVQFGGADGVVLTINPGDVAIIPAGVAHKNVGATADFGCVGAYPHGQHPDMNYGKPGERPRADKNVTGVPTPQSDPVYGKNGPLRVQWTKTAHSP